jgi:hypothetical protein
VFDYLSRSVKKAVLPNFTVCYVMAAVSQRLNPTTTIPTVY